MPDPGVRFCVNALSFTCPTISSTDIENRLELFVQLVDLIHMQRQKIIRGQDIWDAIVIDNVTLNGLLYTPQGKAKIDDVLRQSLMAAVNRMPDYDTDIEWAPVLETIWEKHGEAVAHIVGYHGDRQGIGCLAIDEVPECTIREGDIATCIHFIWNEAGLITYYRKLFEIEATPEDDFPALATLAFPRLFLHPQRTQFNKFHHEFKRIQKNYDMRRTGTVQGATTGLNKSLNKILWQAQPFFVTLFITLSVALLMALLPSATRADVTLSRLFSDHMVLQRGRPISVYGQASPGEQVTVRFHGQTGETTASTSGEWTATLQPMDADRVGQTLTITGKNTLRIDDVLVGDVWLCSGQSNMAFGLGGCDRPSDVASAELPGIRQFAVPLVFSGVPTRALQGNWTVCSPRTANSFSATAFYFARKIYAETKGTVPIGLIVSSVGGTRIDLWLAPEGVVDIPVLHPLLNQNPLPSGPFSLFNGMIYPLAPYGIKGVIWYQGENSELTAQSRDSYYLKMKALVQGWKRLWGVDDLAYYFVQLANWGEIPKTSTPEILPGRGWDADTRLQQMNAMSLPHSGMASALDIGESLDMHPKDKLDLGERLALWALKNDYGRSNLLASGPILRDVAVSGATVVCSFDQTGSGLMVGTKTPYQPTREVQGGTLERFVIAGTDGVWHPAQATIRGDKVVLASPEVKVPHSVSYAFWQNPVGCNLYNREGLPASPFLVEDVTAHHTIKATAGRGGKVSRPGTISLLPRSTALYTITPDPGHYIEDVQMDGVSVGAVRSYTFDPIYADHTLTATFTRSAPHYTLTVKSGGGGTLTPATSLTLPQGGAASFEIRPDGDNLMTVKVDGISLGQRARIAFSDLRANHTLEVTFSGTIRALAGYGGTVSGDGLTPVPYGTDRTFTITPIPGYAISHVLADGVDVGAVSSYTFPNVTRSHTLLATFQSARKDLEGLPMSVPQPDQLLFACLREALPASIVGNAFPISSWPAYLPAGRTLRAQGEPQMETIGGQKFARIVYEKGQGFTFGTYTAPILCQGATIVLVAKPIRNGASTGWTSLVDVFYDRLVFGIRNDNGALCVRRNGSIEQSSSPIPDGQITILTLIVQLDGTYKAYANGVEVMSNTAKNPFASLTPGVAGPFANSITVGRNAPDGWTTFNGNIGDIFLYKVALTDPERRQLESYLASKLLKSNDHSMHAANYPISR